MRLAQLDPWFVRLQPDGCILHVGLSFADAQGVMFECPKCQSHRVLVWFAGRSVAADAVPKPRWAAHGSTLDDLTLSPSIYLADAHGHEVACGWHGFITNGEVRNA